MLVKLILINLVCETVCLCVISHKRLAECVGGLHFERAFLERKKDNSILPLPRKGSVKCISGKLDPSTAAEGIKVAHKTNLAKIFSWLSSK